MICSLTMCTHLLQASALQSDTPSVKFELRGDAPSDGVSPHQALLRLQHSDSGLESFHVAKRTSKGSSSSGSSKLAAAVELKREAAGMLHRSGEWSVDLLVMFNCLKLRV
jgi:Oligosaccharyltransferase subunit Ribophorin II